MPGARAMRLARRQGQGRRGCAPRALLAATTAGAAGPPAVHGLQLERHLRCARRAALHHLRLVQAHPPPAQPGERGGHDLQAPGCAPTDDATAAAVEADLGTRAGGRACRLQSRALAAQARALPAQRAGQADSEPRLFLSISFIPFFRFHGATDLVLLLAAQRPPGASLAVGIRRVVHVVPQGVVPAGRINKSFDNSRHIRLRGQVPGWAGGRERPPLP